MSGLNYYDLLEYHRIAGTVVALLFSSCAFNFEATTTPTTIAVDHACQETIRVNYTSNDEIMQTSKYS